MSVVLSIFAYFKSTKAEEEVEDAVEYISTMEKEKDHLPRIYMRHDWVSLQAPDGTARPFDFKVVFDQPKEIEGPRWDYPVVIEPASNHVIRRPPRLLTRPDWITFYLLRGSDGTPQPFELPLRFSMSVLITVTDADYREERYTVLLDGTLLGYTSDFTPDKTYCSSEASSGDECIKVPTVIVCLPR